ncbi:MAG: KamA family radical SAM protein [Deltaproteobacteria bacterium]|nr:KamA family radical SAM protein [Deltaproteobacteria bacterium]
MAVNGEVQFRGGPRAHASINDDVWASRYNEAVFRREVDRMLSRIHRCPTLELAREQLLRYVTIAELYASHDPRLIQSDQGVRIRDCARCWRGILSYRSDQKTGFSVTQALLDLANGVDRPDLTTGFYAEMIHLVQGLEGRAPVGEADEFDLDETLQGREAATVRSHQLDVIWTRTQECMDRYPHGLDDEVRQRRRRRRKEILNALGGTAKDWRDWRWHARNIVRDAPRLKSLIDVPEAALRDIDSARRGRLPFGVTPFYLSLMDDAGYDAALRAQVFPSRRYVDEMLAHRGERSRAMDFMMEHETSPVDFVTRRYPSVAILKPVNTCPQICVYCQRNWEIEDAMAPGATAPAAKMEAAIRWIGKHPAIREVLVTGGDPLALGDERLFGLLERLAAIPSIERIRIGTRMIVTVPMRVTEAFARRIGALRKPGVREIALVTHVEHPYEVNDDMVAAVDRLRRRGIAVYNQLVFTFFNSRRFESAALRRVLRRIGIDPYYVFNMKGKEETDDFRVPIARLMQELKEEARLLPGLERTDEAVYNLPRLGKNYLRAVQHRDVLTIRPDGSRVYEFHPWEKNIVRREAWVGPDVPILAYLRRLEAIGESPEDYSSIWYYF